MRSASPGFSKTVGNDSVDILINELCCIRYGGGENQQNLELAAMGGGVELVGIGWNGRGLKDWKHRTSNVEH
jgi:hypothetical protein